MPQLAALAKGRAKSFLLSDEDVRRAADEVPAVETIEHDSRDLLPLGTLLRLTQRPRAA
jgi:hypothetical protein